MKNIEEVRAELAAVFRGLKDGTIDTKVAGELTNCAGKIINTLKVELEFAAQRKETPNIPFLNYEKEEGDE